MRSTFIVWALSLLIGCGSFTGPAAAAEPLRLDGMVCWIADGSKMLDLEDAVTLEAWNCASPAA